MHQLIPHLGWLLSPSRKIIDLLKYGDRAHRGNALRRWSFSLFWLEVVGCVALAFSATTIPTDTSRVFAWLFSIYAYSRCNEIAYAFYRDALSRLNQEAQKSDLTCTDRTRMAMRSYFGLAFNFALLYYFLPVDCLFKDQLNGFFESFYFSGVTLATLGYGDITPIHPIARLLALYEVFSGILIIAVAIATYVGSSKGNDETIV